MTIELSDIKNYLRIDNNEEDADLTSLIQTAKSFIKEKTGVEYKDGDDIYELAIKHVVAHFYDKRESVSEKSNAIVPYTMDCLISHIGIRGNLQNV